MSKKGYEDGGWMRKGDPIRGVTEGVEPITMATGRTDTLHWVPQRLKLQTRRTGCWTAVNEPNLHIFGGEPLKIWGD